MFLSLFLATKLSAFIFLKFCVQLIKMHLIFVDHDRSNKIYNSFLLNLNAT